MDNRQDQFTSGYDGSRGEGEPLVKLWHLDQLAPGVHSRVIGQVVVDFEARGIIEFKDEEEFKWLKRRIDGEQRLSVQPE